MGDVNKRLMKKKMITLHSWIKSLPLEIYAIK